MVPVQRKRRRAAEQEVNLLSYEISNEDTPIREMQSQISQPEIRPSVKAIAIAQQC
jgi:hypothetical protein